MIFFTKKNVSGDVVVTNVTRSIQSGSVRVKQFTTNSGVLELSSDEEIFLRSSKVFKKTGEMCAEAFESIYNYFVKQIVAHSHTLKTIQGQLTQKIEGVVESPMYSFAQNYLEQKEAVLKKVRQDPEKVADSMIYLNKRIFELGAHMTSFEVLHMGEQLDLDVNPHNLRRLLINILHAFEDKLAELSIKPHFMFEDSVTETYKIDADYKTLNVAFFNFFDNVVKYAKPYSEIRFYLNVEDQEGLKLIVTMKSLRIDQDELKEVFKFGYRGRHCGDDAGSGVGMYVISKALKLNKLNIEISPDYSDMERHNNRQFILNKFIITQPALS